MTKRILIVLLATTVALATVAAAAQENTGTVKGTAKDEKGNPVTSGTVQLIAFDGKKISWKTDSTGAFVKTGVPTGKYKAQLLIGNDVHWEYEGFEVHPGDNELPIDLAAVIAASKMTPEQRKQLEEQRQKNEQQRTKIKNLNAKIVEAKNLETAGNYDGAIAIYQETVQVDPTIDLLWANLGGAYLGKSAKLTDKAEAAEVASKAVDAMQKAVNIKPNNSAYHNNLGQAYARAGKSDDALKEFTQAAQLDPAGAPRSYFNAGAILTNVAMKSAPGSDDQHKKLEEANEMFRKSLAADPKYNDGEGYYQIATNLLNQATLSKEGKMIVPDGTTEAFQKYLASAPNGKYAEQVKQTLAALGTPVETTYKKAGKKK